MKRPIALLFAAFAALLLTQPAFAEDWPTKPVKIVVGFAPGGTTDILARLVSQKLAENLKQQFVVENRPGATGTIGAAQVAQAKPDGTMLLFGTPAEMVNAEFMLKSIPYDPAQLVPAAVVVRGGNVLLVHPSLPVKTVPEFIDYLRAHPREVNSASPGQGNTTHLSTELLQALTGVDITQIVYRGNGPALTDLLAGQVQMMFSSPVSAIQHIKSGALRPIAMTTPERIKSLPEVPTFMEGGLQLQVLTWFGFIAPPGTPNATIAQINAAVNRVMADAEVIARCETIGVDPVTASAADATAFIAAERQRWGKLIRERGIKSQD